MVDPTISISHLGCGGTTVVAVVEIIGSPDVVLSLLYICHSSLVEVHGRVVSWLAYTNIGDITTLLAVPCSLIEFNEA